MKIELTINGTPRSLDCAPMRRLLDALRYDLGLTGTKEGCGEGECGACTVLIDGEPVNSCLVPVAQVHGRPIVTVEGIAPVTEPHTVSVELHPVQRAFIDHGGTQCGICTPGFVVTAAKILEREPDASRERLRELLAGNLCRCTGYQRIIDAVVEASVLTKKRDNEAAQ